MISILCTEIKKILLLKLLDYSTKTSKYASLKSQEKTFWIHLAVLCTSKILKVLDLLEIQMNLGKVKIKGKIIRKQIVEVSQTKAINLKQTQPFHLILIKT